MANVAAGAGIATTLKPQGGPSTSTASPSEQSLTTESDLATAFNSLLDLETHHYDLGHAAGLRDGLAAGGAEARLFGLEQAFARFGTMGALAARCCVWTARCESARSDDSDHKDTTASTAASTTWPPLRAPARLAQHLTTLHALTDLRTLGATNEDADVGDFDERLRRAQAKARIIERLLGEEHEGNEHRHETPTDVNAAANMEDFKAPLHLKGLNS